MERTLIIIKPGAVARGLVGRILSRFEDRGLVISELKRMTISQKLAREHYKEHEGKPFFEGVVAYMTSSPVVSAVVEGESAVSVVRKMCGSTNPADALPGTIRGDFGLIMSDNVIHSSDSFESAEREIKLFFTC